MSDTNCWNFGLCSEPSTRFHNHVILFERLDGLVALKETGDPGQKEVIHQNTWKIYRNPDTIFSATIEELSSMFSAQELLYKDIASFNAVINRKPDFSGHGDVTIHGLVARDNLYFGVTGPDYNMKNTIPLLKSIDTYLLSNWVESAAKHLKVSLHPLDITISIARTVRQDETAKISVIVSDENSELSLFDQSFRLLASPGTISRKEDGTLLFSSHYPGTTVITLDIFKSMGTAAYGQAKATIEVLPPDTNR